MAPTAIVDTPTQEDLTDQAHALTDAEFAAYVMHHHGERAWAEMLAAVDIAAADPAILPMLREMIERAERGPAS